MADDSVTIQRVIELTFADEDIQVVAVSDGDQAIARIEAQPPDIVLADIGMPGKNGYEVAQYVKQSPRLAHIPVILLTGAFEPVDQARASAAGCEGVLAKPFEPHLVIGRVKELLANVHRPAAMPGAVPEPPAAPAPPDLARHAFWPPELPAAAPEAPKTGEHLDSYFDRLDEAFANLATPAAAPTSALPPAAAAADDLDWFGTLNTPFVEAPVERWDLAPPAAAAHSDLPLSFGSPLSEFDRLPEVAQPLPAPDIQFGLESAAPTSSGPASSESAPEPWIVPTPESTAPEVYTAPPMPVTMPPVQEAAAVVPMEVDLAEPAAPPAPAPYAAVRGEVALPPLADAFAALLAAEQHAETPAAAPLWPSSAPTVAIGEEVIEDIAQRVLDRLSDQVGRETVSRLVSAIAERLVREEIERIRASIR